MAPAGRSKTTTRQSRPDSHPFRITKASKLNVQTQASKAKLDAIEARVCPKDQPQAQISVPQPASTDKPKKRRRDEADDQNNEETATRSRPTKAAKSQQHQKTSVRRSQTESRNVQTLTPPVSSPEPEEGDDLVLPESLEELKSLHRALTQALAVQYAHGGARDVVYVADLIPSMTRLWKRRSVKLEDVQRLLAVWEVVENCDEAVSEVDAVEGPFRLMKTGIGMGERVKLESMWQGIFVEDELQRKYETALQKILQRAQRDEKGYTFVFDSILNFPKVKYVVGAQTQLRQEKIATIRESILSRPVELGREMQTEPDFSRLNISDPSEPKTVSTREDKLKSRTLGLFDRLRAKQLANGVSSSSQPSSADLLRRRALHRIPELIPILRLRQSQKLNGLLRTDLHGSPSATRTAKMKVSFSLEQLVQEIRDSGRVPINPEEIREGLLILGREVPDTWCSVYLGEGVKCVTLQGEAWRKEQVAEWCDKQLKGSNGQKH